VPVLMPEQTVRTTTWPGAARGAGSSRISTRRGAVW
jgi:hypothetical protein